MKLKTITLLVIFSIMIVSSLFLVSAIASEKKGDLAADSCGTDVFGASGCNHFCSWCYVSGYRCNEAGRCC